MNYDRIKRLNEFIDIYILYNRIINNRLNFSKYLLILILIEILRLQMKKKMLTMNNNITNSNRKCKQLCINLIVNIPIYFMYLPTYLLKSHAPFFVQYFKYKYKYLFNIFNIVTIISTKIIYILE